MTQNHIGVLSIEELIKRANIATEFSENNICRCIDDVNQKFKAIYSMFDESSELLLNCNARNAYEEAALHDLRYAMETLYHQTKQNFSDSKDSQRGIFCEGAKVLLSIFVILPNIMHDKSKQEIFDYIIKHDLLAKNPLR